MKAKTIVYQENNPYFCEAKIKAEDISDITSGMQSAYKKYFYEHLKRCFLHRCAQK